MHDNRSTPDLYTNDAAFDRLYPPRIQLLSKRHWTPLAIARKAATFLADVPGSKVLDIGSGVGKFCLAGGHYFPEAHFFGVEQREELYQCAEAAREATRLKNVSFILRNFTRLDLQPYDHFYFYNSFFEHLDESDRIDAQTLYSSSLYDYYSRYLRSMLDDKPSGTRLVTYHSLGDEVPHSYQLMEMSPDLLYKAWVKR